MRGLCERTTIFFKVFARLAHSDAILTVCFLMYSATAPLIEPLLAEHTFVWFVPSVNKHVTSKSITPNETFITDFTNEGFFTRVFPNMVSQRQGLLESHPAELALVRTF